jgi:hypothetical protein
VLEKVNPESEQETELNGERIWQAKPANVLSKLTVMFAVHAEVRFRVAGAESADGDSWVIDEAPGAAGAAGAPVSFIPVAVLGARSPFTWAGPADCANGAVLRRSRRMSSRSDERVKELDSVELREESGGAIRLRHPDKKGSEDTIAMKGIMKWRL